MMALARFLLVVLLAGCPSTPTPVPDPDVVTLSVVGTNDLHGRVARTALLAGYVRNLRVARAADGGAVLLLSGGDVFQGTIESNIVEGASVVRAYNVMGFTAVAIGNHEFDYGPVGEATVPRAEGDDQRGALLARAEEANFPLLAANIREAATHRPVAWPHVEPHVIVEAAGAKVAIIGVTTEETLRTTIAGNVSDLEIAPILDTVIAEARALRGAGADVVIVAAHAGGECTSFENPDDLTTCDPEEEIFRVARQLDPGLVDVIVAGHTHQGVAHRVNGIAIIESFAYGTDFGRVDLAFDRTSRRIVDVRIHRPQTICPQAATSVEECPLGTYEGLAVEVDQSVLNAVSEDLRRAEELRRRSVGVQLAEPFVRHRMEENALGNFLTDVMLASGPHADVAVINAGGIRSDLPAGDLTYGSFYETFPFDNRYATVRMTAAELAGFYIENLQADGSLFSLSGARVVARCNGPSLQVELHDNAGRPIPAERDLTVLLSDFLATGGDGFGDARDRVIDDGAPIRETIVAYLQRTGGELHPAAYFDRARPRIVAPSARPVRCGP